MLGFELFFERCQSPVEVLRKYKDDPDVFISFTAEIEPRGKQEGVSINPRIDPTANKKTTRVGLNPFTHYDTPAGVYSYPLNAMWDDIKRYDIPYVKDMPYVYVFRAKNPDRCARTSTYTEEDFKRDSEELMEMYPQYHLEDIINTLDIRELEAKYPNLPTPSEYHIRNIFIDQHYRNPPLRMFWSLTRALGFLILYAIQKKNETKTKHITIWTHIMRQFYDGIIDDTGSSTIHPNEPTQAVFWTNAQFKVIDRIDRFCGKNKDTKNISQGEWTGENKISKFFGNKKIVEVVRKAYLTNTENKLSDGIKHYLSKSDVHDTLVKLRRGDYYPLSVGLNDIFNVIADNDYKKLAIELYLDNRETDQKVFDDRILSGVSPIFLKERAAELIFLLKTGNSYNSARKLLFTFIDSDYQREREPLYVKLLNRLFEDINSSTMDVIETMLNIPHSKLLKTPKVVSMLTKAFDKSFSYYTSSADSVAVNLINLISTTRTKNPVIWKRFFPYLVNGRTSNYSKGKVLDMFLKSKTGLDDELKEYIKSNANATDKAMHNFYNEVWFQYYGVDPFGSELSQLDSIKKIRKPKSTKGNTKYKVGDIVNMEFENKLIYGVVKSVIPANTAGYPSNYYKIEWENNPNDVSTENENTLLDDYENKPNFSYGDILEDDDGFLYKFISFTSNPKEIEVKDEDRDYLYKNPKDFILYNPETSLHEPAHKVGDKVKVAGYTYKGKIGVITKYTPFDDSGKYKIFINGTYIYRDSVEAVDDDSEDDTEKKTGYKYKPGDVLIRMGMGGLPNIKFVIKDINEKYKKYVYDVYKDHGNGWFLTTKDHSYPISDIDKDNSLKPQNPTYEDHTILKTNKYDTGDTFIGTEGIYKTIVQSFNDDDKSYNIGYYAKDDDTGQWNKYLNDIISQEKFENDIEGYINDGSVYHDIKI